VRVHAPQKENLFAENDRSDKEAYKRINQKKKASLPHPPPADLCTPVRAVLLHLVYRDPTSERMEKDSRPPIRETVFSKHFKFIVNKSARFKSLRLKGFFSHENDL
jgi:hypothetical protein